MEEGRRWEDLGMDSLINVFEKLGLEDLTLGVPFVCKSWYKASLDPRCWKVLNFRELDLKPWSSFNSRFAQEYRLQRFSFTGFMKFVASRGGGSAIELVFPPVLAASMEDLVYASNQCPAIQILVLPHLLPQDEIHIPELIGKWKDLELLEMGLKPSSFPETLAQIGQNCENFVGLQLYGCFKKEDVLAIVTHLPKLKYLFMHRSFVQKEELLMILDGCKELEELDVSKCRGFYVDDEILTKASDIGYFNYVGSKLEENYGDDYDEYEDIHWDLVFGDY